MGKKRVCREISIQDVEHLKRIYRDKPLEYLSALQNYGTQELKDLLQENNMGTLSQLEVIAIFHKWENRQDDSDISAIADSLYKLALEHPFLFSIGKVLEILKAELKQRQMLVKKPPKASTAEKESRRSNVYTERLIFDLFLDPLVEGRRKINKLASDAEFSDQNNELFGTGSSFSSQYSKWLSSNQGKVTELMLEHNVYKILKRNLDPEQSKKALNEYLGIDKIRKKYQALLV
ncbi:MAG: hypothetical protein ACTIM4_08550 [Marinomonas sp.]